jgi:DNA-binding NarL/FixJ family response regulator
MLARRPVTTTDGRGGHPGSLAIAPPSPRAPAGVLLLEADIGAANAVQALLARTTGHRVWVLHESSLPIARKLLAACRFRLILLDPVLPDTTPGQVLRTIKNRAPDTPVVVLQGGASTVTVLERGDIGDAAAAQVAGAAAVIGRDQEDALVQVVRDVLGISGE